jgi:hypothetical protein
MAPEKGGITVRFVVMNVRTGSEFARQRSAAEVILMPGNFLAAICGKRYGVLYNE